MPIYDVNSLELKVGERVVPLAFVEDGNYLYLASPVKGTRWPSYILRNGIAEINLGGNSRKFSAALVSDEGKKSEAMGLFSRKYGLERTGKWYGEHYRVICLSEMKELIPEPGESQYYHWLEAEFDSIADEYDHHIYGNPVNSLLRENSLKLLFSTFPGKERLLEVGCGTGTETIELLKSGHEIVAVDISQKMLDAVRKKAILEGVSSQLTTLKGNADNIGALAASLGAHSFQGIYSTFGAINCVSDIHSLPEGFHQLLCDRGKLVLGIYNRMCASEILGYMTKLKFGHSLARLKPMVPEGESRFCIDVYAYTYMEIRNIFRGHFAVDSVYGVPVFIPPSNFSVYVEKFSRKFNSIKAFDAKIGKIWPFSILGDHFLTVMTSLEKQ